MWTSVCCGELPLYDNIHFWDGEWYGLCGDCCEHTDFNYEQIDKE